MYRFPYPLIFLLQGGMIMYIIMILQLVKLNRYILQLYGGDFMGRVYGYNRVSTQEQHLDRGRKSIEDFCRANNYTLSRIYEDKQTGTNFNRPRYIVLKEDVLREGDILIVPEYDRLGRAEETKHELEYFKAHGIRVIFLDIPSTMQDMSNFSDDTSALIFSFMNDMLISFFDLMARTEMRKRVKRQREGIDAMKERGEWDRYGRPRILSKDQFAAEYQKVVDGEIGSLALLRSLSERYGLKRDTYFRYVREYKAEHYF